MGVRHLLFGAAVCTLTACAPPHEATPYPSSAPEAGAAAKAEEPAQGVVTFAGRELDLEPFLDGFPYSSMWPDLEHGRLFYVHEGATYTLRSVALPTDGTAVDLTKGEALTDVDYAKRSLWNVRWHEASDTLWMHADARNDEAMNLWTLALGKEGAEPKQVTQADYVYAWGFDEPLERIAYLARTGTKVPYTTCLRLLEPASGADEKIVCDSPKLSFTWGTPRFSPDGKTVYFNAQVEGDRRRVQLVRVNLDEQSPRARPITDPKKPRRGAGTLRGGVSDERVLYLSNEDGYRNLWSWSPKTKRNTQLTRFQDDVMGAVVLESGVFLAHGTPAGTTIELVDARSGESLRRAGMPGRASILDGHGDHAVWSTRAPDTVFELNLSRVGPQKPPFDNAHLVTLPPELEASIVGCEAEPVKIPTFDRELHAFVLHPKQPPPPERRLIMVRSFYGGSNTYTRFDQVMCAAGITVISPSVRGSSGFGREFSALNDGDLGGAEIEDLFWIGRWATERFEVPAARVGVYGRSHGGYATMRAMTFAASESRNGERFDFGFGLADAGFSDIEAFWKATNIPDWVVLEAGDPEDPADLERLSLRSPVNGTAELRAPIFVMHGENDWRVPVEGSRIFVERARAAGKDVTYVEVPGQGHHVEGLERIVEVYQARFDFLERVLDGEAQAPQ